MPRDFESICYNTLRRVVERAQRSQQQDQWGKKTVLKAEKKPAPLRVQKKIPEKTG